MEKIQKMCGVAAIKLTVSVWCTLPYGFLFNYSSSQ